MFIMFGDVIWILLGVKYWYGVVWYVVMVYLVIYEVENGFVVDWFELVDDEMYFGDFEV